MVDRETKYYIPAWPLLNISIDFWEFKIPIIMNQPGVNYVMAPLLNYLNLCSANINIFLWYQNVLAKYQFICMLEDVESTVLQI